MIKMIKICTVLFAFVVLLDSSAMTAPFEGDIEEKNTVSNFMNQKLPELEISHTRYKRATCQIPFIGDWIIFSILLPTLLKDALVDMQELLAQSLEVALEANGFANYPASLKVEVQDTARVNFVTATNKMNLQLIQRID
ncbi:hypothetical protein HZH68_007894 [Vespula germanica]|uniref:Uncharacterized protein n=1 Tax=Vespula germanica TaxID=30212 RepID=A0A834N7P5_VESGE|nr:hypothetical protein HZH68_007894 [Vespula germanica]